MNLHTRYNEKHDKWEVVSLQNEKMTTIIVTELYEEAESLTNEAVRASLNNEFDRWYAKQKTIRYSVSMKQWYIVVTAYKKKYYLGHLNSYAKTKRLYEDIEHFIANPEHTQSDFSQKYKHWIEQYKINQMIKKVIQGKIFTEISNGKIEITLSSHKLKYHFGEFHSSDISSFKNTLVKQLKRGMTEFNKWYDRYHLKKLQEDLLMLIGQPKEELTIMNFAKRHINNPNVFPIDSDTFLISDGQNKVKIKLNASPAGIIYLPSIEYI